MVHQNFLKFFIFGWYILVIAIIINFFAKLIKLNTWYDYLTKIGDIGFLKASSGIGMYSLIFLYIIYPLLLGLSLFLIYSNFSK
jgi:FtsH-binding integral membrane protein